MKKLSALKNEPEILFWQFSGWTMHVCLFDTSLEFVKWHCRDQV